MKAILVIAVWLLCIFAKQIWNWYRIEKQKKNIAHGLELVIMCLLGFAEMWFVCNIHSYEQRVEFLDVLIFQASSYWLLFELGLNLMRGKEWYYRGKTARSHKFWNKFGFGPYLMSKVFALVGMVYGIIWVFKYYY